MAEQILPLTTLTVKGVTYTIQDKRVDAILEQLSNITNVIDDEATSIETTWSSDKINALISNLVSLNIVVVNSLPVSDIDSRTIYLLPKNPVGDNNVYTEYLNINGSWEAIGDTEIDLTDYTTKVFVEANYAKKTDVYTKGEVDTLIRNIPDENTEYLGDETTIHINGVTNVISALYTSNNFKNAVKNEQVQADWNQQNNAAKDYIKNKPEDLVHTSSTVGLLKNDGTVDTTQYISGNYLRLVDDLDNFEALEGIIVKYVGQTNNKYTNGHNYKKVVEQITIPAGTDYITVNYSNKLQFDKVGIYNGIYYKTDKTDEISSQIIEYDLLSLLNSEGDVTYSNYTNSYIVPYVYAFYYKSNSLYFAKINSVEYQTINNILYPDKITFETGDVKYCHNSLVAVGHYNTQGGQTLSESEIVIFENLNGDKIYCRKINDKYKLLVLNKIGSTYKVANPDTSTFIYEYYTTSTTRESIIENVTKWQQWDSQPREDTSHDDLIEHLSLDYDQSTNRIQLKNGDTVISELDASIINNI